MIMNLRTNLIAFLLLNCVFLNGQPTLSTNNFDSLYYSKVKSVITEFHSIDRDNHIDTLLEFQDKRVELYNSKGKIIRRNQFSSMEAQKYDFFREIIYGQNNEDSIEYIVYLNNYGDTTSLEIRTRDKYLNAINILKEQVCQVNNGFTKSLYIKNRRNLLHKEFSYNRYESKCKENIMLKLEDNNDTLIIIDVGALNIKKKRIYNKRGNLIEELKFRNEVLKTRTVIKYNSNGLKIEEETFNPYNYKENQYSNHTWKYTIKYNEFNNITEIIGFQNDEVFTVGRFEYKYDHKKNWIKRKRYVDNKLNAVWIREVDYSDN